MDDEQKRQEFIAFQNRPRTQGDIQVDYEDLVAEIEEAPLTQVPGLLATIVRRAKAHPVFMDDTAMMRYIATILESANEPDRVDG